jgi:hypothetical protein
LGGCGISGCVGDGCLGGGCHGESMKIFRFSLSPTKGHRFFFGRLFSRLFFWSVLVGCLCCRVVLHFRVLQQQRRGFSYDGNEASALVARGVRREVVKKLLVALAKEDIAHCDEDWRALAAVRGRCNRRRCCVCR